MNKINQKLEGAANVLIIIVTIMLGVVIAKQFFFASPTVINANGQNNSLSQPQVIINAPLKIEGVNFAEQSKTLIVALQAGCPYCSQSAPFYKRLIEESRDKNVKIVAVLPTSLEESKDYIQKLGIDNLEVKQSTLDNIQVRGTPTLLLTNDKGEVTNAWVGKLPAPKEDEVINAIIH